MGGTDKIIEKIEDLSQAMTGIARSISYSETSPALAEEIHNGLLAIAGAHRAGLSEIADAIRESGRDGS